MQLERDPIHHVFSRVPSGHLLYRLFLRNNHELLTNYRLHLHDHLVPSWWRCHRIRFALFESECKPNPVHSFCIISIWHRSWTLQSRRTKDLNSIVNGKEVLHERRFYWINNWSTSSWNRFNVPLKISSLHLLGLVHLLCLIDQHLVNLSNDGFQSPHRKRL